METKKRASTNIVDLTRDGPWMDKIKGWMAGNISSPLPPERDEYKPQPEPINGLTTLLSPALIHPDIMETRSEIDPYQVFNNPGDKGGVVYLPNQTEPRMLWDFYDSYPAQKFQKR